MEITASAPSFTDGSLSVPLVAPVLALNRLVTETSELSADEPFLVRTGIPNQAGTGIFTQSVSLAAGDQTMTVSSSDPIVGQLVNASTRDASVPVVVAAGEFQSALSVATGGVAFDPRRAGTTTVTASAPGFDASFTLASQAVTVTP